MADISIIVEGEEDIRFLQDFIQLHFKQEVENDVFIEIGGKTEKIHLSRTKIKSSSERPNRNILIFDADDRDYESTLNRIITKVDELQLKIDFIFLLPDNSSKGNLESLLRSCVNPKNVELLDCIKSYADCKAKIKLEHSREISEKEELFIYHGSFDESGISTATKRSYLINHIWDLKNDRVNALKEFLSQFFGNGGE